MKRVIRWVMSLRVAPFSNGIVVEDSDTFALRFSHGNFIERRRTGEVIGMTCVVRASASLSVQSYGSDAADDRAPYSSCAHALDGSSQSRPRLRGGEFVRSGWSIFICLSLFSLINLSIRYSMNLRTAGEPGLRRDLIQRNFSARS